MQGSGRPPGRTSKKGNSRGQLEAWDLAAEKGMPNLFDERDACRVRGKVTSGGRQRAKEGSRGSNRHAA